MTPNLNWQELALLIEKITPLLQGLFVDRIIVPERKDFPDGYLKGEWILRLTGRKQEQILLMSIRPRHPYLAAYPGKGPRANSKATRSPFDQCLSKHLKGAKLLSLESLPQERTVVFWFSEEGNSDNRLGLVLTLIPAIPEAYLVLDPKNAHSNQGWRILARSRKIRDETQAESFYLPPDGTGAPLNPGIRTELFNPPSHYYSFIEKELKAEAFLVRSQMAEKVLRHLLKQAQERLRQSQTALKGAENEEDWQKLGDLLKSSLGSPTEIRNSIRLVFDYVTSQTLPVLCDPKLTLQEQVTKFYQNARRKQRRAQEAQSRIDRLKETICQLENSLEIKPTSGDWSALTQLERLTSFSGNLASDSDSVKKKTTSAWLGKSFVSKDGLTLWAGRSKDENLDLTFKHARGNDLWMHVRGKPGAHVVIPLQPGKSAPLETLLDAAVLVIYYSGGQNWGKTEVDYTFKKYVKRIKDSSEASYTHNRTLLIEIDPVRLKRLLDQSS